MAVTVTFDPNGGTCGTETMSVESGAAIGNLPPPSREGHLFIGWYQTESYGWSLVSPWTTFSAGTEVTARWMAKAPVGEERSYYYPGVSVESVTGGLKYLYNTDGTAYAFRFANTGTPENDNSDKTGEVVVPYAVMNNDKEYTVVAIGQNEASGLTIAGNENLTSIWLPTTVKELGRSAFELCTKLELFYGAGIESISMNSLRTVSTDLLQLSLPSLIATNSLGSLSANSSLESLSLPTLESLGSASSASLSALQTVSLPSTTKIGSYLLSGGTSLKNASLPSATYIGDRAFNGCTADQIKLYLWQSEVTINDFGVPPKAICLRTDMTLTNDSGEVVSFDVTNPPLSIQKGTFSVPLEWYDETDAPTFSITFDAQGGTAISGVTAKYSYDVPTLAALPTRVGYIFEGFYTDPAGMGLKYYNSDGTSARRWDWLEDKTLYAKWTAKTYTVTLDAQEGIGGTAFVTATYGSAMPSITMPTRVGYAFDGYFYTDPQTLVETQYYNEAGTSANNWDKTSGATLYAKWTGNKYTVTLDKQGGSGGPESVEATYGSAMPTDDVTMPTRTGYMFGGYFTGTNGTGTQYYTDAGASARNWDIAANTTLYAQWLADKTIVTLNPNDGSGGTGKVTATYGEAMPPAEMATRTGYTFGGYWDTSETTGGKQYYNADGTSANDWDKINSTATLYARWEVNTYTATIQPGYEEESPATLDYNVDSVNDREISITLPTRTGYAIERWVFEAVNGSFPAMPAIEEDESSETPTWNLVIRKMTATNFTATPIWKSSAEKTYTVTFNANDGTGSMDPQTITYGSGIKLHTNTFTYAEKVFGGWSATISERNYFFSDGADGSWMNVANGGSVTLYATWRDASQGSDSERAARRRSMVEPTAEVPISPLPNQVFDRTYDGIKYTLHFRTFNGMMYADVSVDDEVVANGVRCVPEAWLIPNYAAAASGAGNFKFTTLGDAYPWYEDFGGTCKLEFYDEAAYGAAQAE